jgi:SAM-dependent methyltransferase
MPGRGGDLPAAGLTGPGWIGERAGRCVWCGATLGEAGRRHGRAECARCGTATTDPVPDAESLDAAYGDWYWPQAGKRFSLVGDALLRRSRAAMAERIDQVAPPGPILDVGAGEGTLLDALRSRGREASGLERNSDRADIENRPIAEVEGRDRYAAIVFWHSLEHLGDPGDTATEAARLLRPGGVIVIAVPNYASLQASVFGDRWLHLDLPRHLVHLTSGALTSGLEERGFEVASVSQTRAGQVVIGWLDGLVASLPGGLNLYHSLRRKSARRIEIGPGKRAAAIAAGVILFPVAFACSAFEILSRRSGTVYVEARLA